MWIKIRFHGHLKEKVCEELKIQADTMLEVLRYISVNYRDTLKPPLSIGRWPVKIPGYETKESFYCPLYTEEADIYPLFSPTKSDWVRIGIGVILIAIGIVLAPYTGGASTKLSAMSFEQLTAYFAMHMAYAAGTSLILQGTMGLLSPTPATTANSNDPEASKYLNSAQNTTALGTYIPVGYGRYRVGGHYISFNISTKEFAYKEV